MCTNADRAFDHDLVTSGCWVTAMHCMSTKFGVDSSSHFFQIHSHRRHPSSHPCIYHLHGCLQFLAPSVLQQEKKWHIWSNQQQKHCEVTCLWDLTHWLKARTSVAQFKLWRWFASRQRVATSCMSAQTGAVAGFLITIRHQSSMSDTYPPCHSLLQTSSIPKKHLFLDVSKVLKWFIIWYH